MVAAWKKEKQNARFLAPKVKTRTFSFFNASVLFVEHLFFFGPLDVILVVLKVEQIITMKILSLIVLAGTLLVSQAFVSIKPRCTPLVVLQSSLQEQEDVKHEIEEMRKEAQQRLERLTQQMEELKRETAQKKVESEKKTPKKEQQPKMVVEDSLDSLEGDLTKQPPLEESPKTVERRDSSQAPVKLDLLDGTRVSSYSLLYC